MDNISMEINNSIENLLAFTSNDKYYDELQNAKSIYNKGVEEETRDLGFNYWLIFDYKFENNSSFIDELIDSEEYEKNEDILYALKNSFISVFRVKRTENNVFLKDIFTKKDYPIENYDLEHTDGLVSCRIIHYNNKYYITDEFRNWDDNYEDTIRKSILEKYNDYSKEHKNVKIGEFIKKNPLVLYKFLIILKNSEIDLTFSDEEFYVFQSVYLIKNKKDFFKIKEKSDKIEEHEDHEGKVLILKNEGIILSEIVINDKKIEVECTSDDELDKANLIIKDIFGNSIKKVKDEVLNIEDLL